MSKPSLWTRLLAWDERRLLARDDRARKRAAEIRKINHPNWPDLDDAPTETTTSDRRADA